MNESRVLLTRQSHQDWYRITDLPTAPDSLTLNWDFQSVRAAEKLLADACQDIVSTSARPDPHALGKRGDWDGEVEYSAPSLGGYVKRVDHLGEKPRWLYRPA